MIHRAPTSFPGGPTPGARPRASAFTLLELLVVLALLALLIALLLPTLAAGREYAKVMQCLSNNRQIAAAWTMYLNDHDDDFPMWSRNIQWFYGGTDPAVYAEDIFQEPTRIINPYVGKELDGSLGSEVFECPSDREIRSVGTGFKSPTRGHPTHDYYGNSYVFSTALIPKVNPHNPDEDLREFHFRSVNLNDVELSTSQVMMLGEIQWFYSMGDRPWDAQFHNKRDTVPLAFLDGHAKFTQITRGEGADLEAGYSWFFRWPKAPDTEDT